jgi:hypothetical protein
MTDRIEPALTSEEWRAIEDVECVDDDAPGNKVGIELVYGDPSDELTPRIRVEDGKVSIRDGVSETAEVPIAVVIAIANDALPDTDQRKITRDAVADLRYAAYMLMEVSREADSEAEMESLHARSDRLTRLADALESYLPPPEPTP